MDNEAAFESLVRRHEGRIYGLCHRMLGDPDEARDVSQEVFLAAWKGLARFRAESAVYTWLYRIAINLSLRRRRTLGRFRRAISRFAGFSPDGPEGGPDRSREVLSAIHDPRPGQAGDAENRAEYNPERSAEAAEQRALVERAMRVLAPEVRAALILRDRDGLSYEELSGALDWKIGTAKSRISRARAAVADELSRIAPDLAPRRGKR